MTALHRELLTQAMNGLGRHYNRSPNIEHERGGYYSETTVSQLYDTGAITLVHDACELIDKDLPDGWLNAAQWAQMSI